MTWTFRAFLILALISWVNANEKVRDELGVEDKSSKRDQKVFSLFSIVTFKNSGCRSTSGTTGSGINRNGNFAKLYHAEIIHRVYNFHSSLCKSLYVTLPLFLRLGCLLVKIRQFRK